MSEDLVDVHKAAQLLGVTVQHVRRLAEQGDLVFVARGLVDRGSIRVYLAEREASRPRAWSEETAWAAVALLSGVDAGWIGPTQTSRLRSHLRGIDAETLTSRARNRAKVHRYTGHRSAAARLADQIIIPDRGVLDLVSDSATDARVDGYLSPNDEQHLVKEYALSPDAVGRFILRATSFDLATVRHLLDRSDMLVALDAAVSLDPRERGAGQARLEKRLAEFRSAQRTSETRRRMREEAAARKRKAASQAADRVAAETKRAEQRTKAEQRLAEQRIQSERNRSLREQKRRPDLTEDIRTREAKVVAETRRRLEQKLLEAQRRVDKERKRLADAQEKAADAQRKLAALERSEATRAAGNQRSDRV